MSFVVQSYDLTGRQVLGSDGTILAYDLKTIRGVKNRIQSKKWNKQVVSVKIFRQLSSNRYNDKMQFVESMQLRKPLEATEGFVPSIPFSIPSQVGFNQ